MLVPGTKLQERYLIEKVLEEGGMSVVYLAKDTSLDNQNAVKEMKDYFTDDVERGKAIDEFRKEGRILANLHHIGLPRVTNFFEENGVCYLVLDFIEGETMDKAANRWGGILPENVMLPWAWELSQVLDYLHQQSPPIIFRDLKPSNIMVTPQRRLKLIDFGIAKLFIKEDPTRTLIRGAGTPGYAPPEQYGNFGRQRTDVRTDIYSFGATLFTLLTGEVPPEATVRWMNGVPLPPLKDLNSKVSPELERIILRCMQLKAEDRYPTVKDLMRDMHPLVFPKKAPLPHLGDDTEEPVNLPKLVAAAAAAPKKASDPTAEAARVPPVAPAQVPKQGPEAPPPDKPPPAAKDEVPIHLALASMTRTPRQRASSPIVLWSLVVAILSFGIAIGAIIIASQSVGHGRTPVVSIAPAPSSTPAASSPSASASPHASPSPLAVAGNSGIVHILTDPLGARVLADWLDTAVVGSGGYELTLPAGKHVLKTTADGYLSQTTEIQIAAGERHNLRIQLVRASVLNITSAPSGARIKIDGVARGNTPGEIDELAPALYTISLTLPGYEPWQKKMAIGAGEKRVIDAELRVSTAPVHSLPGPAPPAEPVPTGPKATPW